MSLEWQTNPGNLGTFNEREPIEVVLEATSPTSTTSYQIISGSLPRGLRLVSNTIKGSPTEVNRPTTNRFVVRASDGAETKDRTFSITIEGADEPTWITAEGFLPVGPNNTLFVLDNDRVDFQLEAIDPDLPAGDTVRYSIPPNGGQLPPGLSLSTTGQISGYTSAIYAIDLGSASGAYDTTAFDVVDFDVGLSPTTGYDSFLFDNQTFDYFLDTKVPKKLSRYYSFTVDATDGRTTVSRTFKIYVVSSDFLRADNTIIQAGTGVFRADNTFVRAPLWVTPAYLGKRRANNYVTVYLDVYNPSELNGTIAFFLQPTNPDGSISTLPPGLQLDSNQGELVGRVPYQPRITKNYQFTIVAVNYQGAIPASNYILRGSWSDVISYNVGDVVQYRGYTYLCIFNHINKLPNNTDYWVEGTSSSDKTFNIDIIGEIESGVRWITDSALGSIKPRQDSIFYVKAETDVYGGKVFYSLVSGDLPPGLSLLDTGEIIGKVNQFADGSALGLTRFYDETNGVRDYSITFDFDTTSFDRQYEFTIRASDSFNFSQSDRKFNIVVNETSSKSFANIYIKAFQKKIKRDQWYDFITDNEIFSSNQIYRYGDPSFGVQTEIKALLFAGIESVEAVKFVQAMSRNHYNKQIKLGSLNSAVAKDPVTQEIIYEVIYVEIIDDLEKNKKSISSVVDLKNDINSKVLISQTAIKVDSDIPYASDSDHQRIFPNSIANMRSRIRSLGERDRTFLPLWMRSIQVDAPIEPGFTKCLVLCYALPGESASIIRKIKARNFDFKQIDFEADRYVIDILDGEIQDKYLAFPQRGEKQ